MCYKHLKANVNVKRHRFMCLLTQAGLFVYKLLFCGTLTKSGDIWILQQKVPITAKPGLMAGAHLTDAPALNEPVVE